jgi:hypothetical protein
MVQYIELAVVLFLAIWLISILIRPNQALKHWHHQFKGIELTPGDTYKLIQAEINRLKIPELHICYRQFFEAGIFSAKREYMCVEYKKFSLDICCAKFGDGYYMSWWLRKEEDSIISKIPILRDLLGKNPAYPSYSQIDTATMFQSSIHDSILKIIDDISNAKGVRLLSEFERQPVNGK